MSQSRTVASTGDPDPGGYTILVAVGNPDHTSQLMRTAADLASVEDGTIHVVSVVSKDYDSPFGIFDDETIREEFAGDRKDVLDAAVAHGEERDVTVSGTVVVDRSVSRGVIDAAQSVDADAILVGWTGPTWRPRTVLGSTVDALLERAPTDVYVERIGATADGVERVLVPVAGGPHEAIAARAGHAIALANEASLTLLSVESEPAPADDPDAAPSEEPLEPEEHVSDANDALRDLDGVDVETRVLDAEDVVDAIVSAAVEHDLVVMGATRGGPLRAALVGSIPRAVTDRTDRTVVLARHWTGPSRLTRLLGRLRRR